MKRMFWNLVVAAGLMAMVAPVSAEKTESYFELLRAAEQDVRYELGEAEYDAYLYATGRPNRSAIRSGS